MATPAAVAAGDACAATTAASRATNDSVPKDDVASKDRPFADIEEDRREEDAIKTAGQPPFYRNRNIMISILTGALASLAQPFYAGFIFAQYIFDVMGSDTRFIGAGTTLMGLANLLLVHWVGKAADGGSKERIVKYGAILSMSVSVGCIGIVGLFSVSEPVCYWCYT